MSSVIVKAGLLKDILFHLKKIVTTCNLTFNAEGMTIQTLDSNNIIMIQCHINKEGFVKNELEEDIVIGVNLDHFCNMLKTIKRDDELTLKFTPEVLTLSNVNHKTKRKSSYKLKLLDMDVDEMEIDEDMFEPTTTFDMNPDYFMEICSAMSNYDDECSMEAKGKMIFLAAEGLVGGCSFELTNDCDDIYEIKNTEDLKIKCLAKQLSTLSEASKLTDTVSIKFGDETPIILYFKISDYGYIRYFMSPKSEE